MHVLVRRRIQDVDARDKRNKAGLTASIKHSGRFAGDWATALVRPLEAA